jgi:Ni/Fe-hydrogenase subunit HybB-like protein
MNRVRRLKLVLWTLIGLAAPVAVGRFLFGLGTSTNLSDANPWGIWVGFDVMGGVALAAGGFIVTATVYIFKLEKFHAIVRPAVLTAFLGYAAVAVGLLFDLGLPWNIWHMIVYWNPHSPLFEVGWCVMLYLTILSLEFFPVPADEYPRLAGIRAFLIKIRLPLVLVGIGLSSLHQSSLGSLFLIMPYRLHPLWYSPILPVLFLLSAIGLGLAMVIFESHVTAWLYRRKPETEMLSSLAAACRWVLLGYLALRFSDLLARGQARTLVAPGWRTGLFWAEVLLMAVVPAILFSLSRVRSSRAGQWLASALAVFGIVLNRLDVGGVAHPRPDGSFYLPAWSEVAISVGVVSAAVLAFLFVVERFKVWEERPVDPAADPRQLPEFDPVSTTWLGTPRIAARTVYSLAFVIAAALGFGVLKAEPAQSRGIAPAPVQRARGGDTLFIDGSRSGFGVAFNHAAHQAQGGGKESCAQCHHMNLPRDENSPCSLCHRDMYQASDVFRHDWHASPAGAGIPCYRCHAQGQARSAVTAVKCDACHGQMVPAGAVVSVKQYHAVAYVEAMHRLCMTCHVDAQCGWCHKPGQDVQEVRDFPMPPRSPRGGSVVLPPRD